jgi:hypothetical protein
MIGTTIVTHTKAIIDDDIFMTMIVGILVALTLSIPIQ